jgi:divalent metal cation (Fe/Co/Zn/Cd) transporter
MRWIGHELHADVDLIVNAKDSTEAHRLAHDAEHELTHAVPRLRTAVVHAYPADKADTAMADHHQTVGG